MKKKLIGLALIGVTTLGVSSVSALTMDLSTFKGYGECKITGFCDGTNVVIIGHRMYQLNNHDIVLSGPLYTKAQLEYGTTEAPIYYLLDGGEVLQEVGPYKVSLKATPKEQRTMEQIGGYNYKITMIDDVSLEDIEDKDEVNDTALATYVGKITSELLDTYKTQNGDKILDSIEYSEETNTLKFTINQKGLGEKLASFFTAAEDGDETSILDMFETYLADAIRASYNVDGKTNTSVDIEKGAVELAKSLLLAMAQNNGYKVTNAGELTYGMVANTSATGTFVYETKGLEQTVKYTLEFYYDASDDIDALEESKDEANDTAVNGVLAGINLGEYKTSDQKQILRGTNGVKYEAGSNTLTFDVTRDGLYELLSGFASVKNTDGTVLDSILEAFQSQVTEDTDLESITFKVNEGEEVTVSDTSDVVEVAKAILLAMASANGSETTDPTQLTYLDVIGTKATATFSYKVPYTKEKATLTYTVEFKYTPTEAEKQAEKNDMTTAIDTLFLEDIAEGFNNALTDFKTDDGKQILKSIEYETASQTLTFDIDKNGLHSELASFADLEATVSFDTLQSMLDDLGDIIDLDALDIQTSGPMHVAELFDFFKSLGITEASYEVNGETVKVNLEDSPVSIAAALLKKMAGVDKSASSLTFLDVVGKEGKGKFTFPMVGASGQTYEIEYTLEFKYEPDMAQETKDREEASNKILNDYANTVLSEITEGELNDVFDATKTKYEEETKTVTFAVKETGLEKSIVDFLDTDAGASIVDVFAKFADGATKASYTVGQDTVEVPDLSNPVQIASELLKKMYGQEKNAHDLTYGDIVKGKNNEATGKFTYSVEGSNKTIEIEYTLKFTFEKTAVEISSQKSEVAKESLNELSTALKEDTDNVENSTYNEDTKTLAVELKDEAQTKNLSDTILKEQGEESIVPVVESLMDGAKSVNYKVSQVDYFDETNSIALLSNSFGGTSIDLSGSQKTAKEVAEEIILEAAKQVRDGATKDDLKYSDLKNVKIEMQFNYDVPGEEEDATTDYIVEFLYASQDDINAHKLEEAKTKQDATNDGVLDSYVNEEYNTKIQTVPNLSSDENLAVLNPDSNGDISTKLAETQQKLTNYYNAVKSIEYKSETNEIIFNITTEGKEVPLVTFLTVGTDILKPKDEAAGDEKEAVFIDEDGSFDGTDFTNYLTALDYAPIVDMFSKFIEGSKKIDFAIGTQGFETFDSQNTIETSQLNSSMMIGMFAYGLLGKMSGLSKIEPTTSYSAIIGDEHKATARVYYDDEETGEEYYVEYTLIFNEYTE